MSVARPDNLAELLFLRGGLLFFEEPDGAAAEPLEEHQQLGFHLELAQLGYVASDRLRARALRATPRELTRLRDLALSASAKATGGHSQLLPMFRRFPADVPDDTLTLWWDRVIVHYLQQPQQPCVLCCRTGTTHVLDPCMHIVCDRCFDGSNYSGCPICNRTVNPASPFFRAAPPRPGHSPSSQTFQLLDLGNPTPERTMQAACRELFVKLCQRTQALSPTDVDTLLLVTAQLPEQILGWLPETIPVRENRATIFGTLLRRALLGGADAKADRSRGPRPDVTPIVQAARPHLTTATDVLRLIAVYSGAPVALVAEAKVVLTSGPEAARRFGKRATPKRGYIAIAHHRFKVAPMPRDLRRQLLAILEQIPAERMLEDLRRHDSRWVWVARMLHPGEYAERYPNVARVFSILRNGPEDSGGDSGDRPWESKQQAKAKAAAKKRAEAETRPLHRSKPKAERAAAESLPKRMMRTLLAAVGRAPVPVPSADGPGPQTVEEAAAEAAAAKAAASEAAAEAAASEAATTAAAEEAVTKTASEAAASTTAIETTAAKAAASEAAANAAAAGAPRQPLRAWPTAVEAALASGATGEALVLLAQRPGEFLRRFDLLLRRAPRPDDVVDAFAAVLPRTATPALVALRSHLAVRARPLAARVFWPKVDFFVPSPPADRRPTLSAPLVARTTRVIDEELLRRFAEKPAHEAALLDEALGDIIVPFNERTASKSAVQLPRGSSVAIPDAKQLRLFMHWCEPAAAAGDWDATTDLDLSVGFFDEKWELVGTCAYYQLTAKDAQGNALARSSGDFTSAPYPDGAAEFVDFDRARARAAGYRYAVMVVNAYSGLPFKSLERATAGVMLRDDPAAGDHFDPRTVALAFALAGEHGVFMPLVVDLQTSRLHWLDAYSTGQLLYNNVATSKLAIGRICPAMLAYFASGTRPSMLDLGRYHAAARCRRVLVRGATPDGGPAETRVFVRHPDEPALAFLERLRGGACDERLAATVATASAADAGTPGALEAQLGAAPVLALLLRGDVTLPEGSASYALFRQRLIPTLAAADLLT